MFRFQSFRLCGAGFPHPDPLVSDSVCPATPGCLASCLGGSVFIRKTEVKPSETWHGERGDDSVCISVQLEVVPRLPCVIPQHTPSQVSPVNVPCWLGGNVGFLLVRRGKGCPGWSLSFLLQQEAEANLRKAKQGYKQRCEDHDKARLQVAKAEEEQQGTGPGAGTAASKALDKRRRLEEEAKNKVL